MSPTQRALALARELGFTVQVVERFNSFTKRRHDLFGVIDLVAIKQGVGILGIQATADNGGHHADRRAKSQAEPRLLEWLLSGGRFEVWSFGKKGPRGKRKVWTVRREELIARDGVVVSVEAA